MIAKTPTPQLIELAKRHSYNTEGRGRVTFSGCRLCGHIDWQSSDGDGPLEIHVEFKDQWGQQHGCRDCGEVQRRAPEIYRWVASALGAEKAFREIGLDLNEVQP